MNSTATKPAGLDEIELLTEANEIVRQHGRPELVEWFCGGVDDCMNDRGSLDECLGIGAHKQGARRAARKYNGKQRDYYLARAHDLSKGKKPWYRAGDLSDRVKQFHEAWWPKYQDLPAPLEEWTELSKILFMAFQHGAKYKNGLPPVSQKQLHDIYNANKK